VRTQKPSDSISLLSEKFLQAYGAEARFVQAPGRVNLIGEHTDYNDGFVLPAAIQMQTTVGVARRNDGRLAVFSQNYGERFEFEVEHLPREARHHWSDYVIGVSQKLKEKGVKLPGASLLIEGNVPEGAGLSSSASLEVAVCEALLEVSGAKMEREEIARLCQRAENEFVGARCGIMDQFIAVHGRKDHALLLDCRSLEYRYQPIPEQVRLVICNTMVRHSVAGGEYNLRRKECEEAAQFFAELKPGVKALRDVSVEDFESHAGQLPEVIRKRARHVITEDARVIEAAAALECHDVARFGELMKESHASLRDDFEVSCRELDVMVELAGKIDGTYGARMTGGGFGGCTINLVQGENVDAFQARIRREYEAATGLDPDIYICTAAEGLRRVA
jgi:galactokinase